MTIAELQARARKIAADYRLLNKQQGSKAWDVSARMAGFVTDIGELNELVMAKQGFRTVADVDAKLAHELGDCLWSLLVLADELGVDLQQAFLRTADELDERVAKASRGR